MRKLLFSRSQKNHFSDAVVRMGKNNLGFSLVELIVIIAIMAILAGIAIPVLGSFIEKAKKGNDISLIGDIMRAVEIGNKSGAYINENSFALGSLEVPIGFIVLTQDSGMQVITSSTERATLIEGACEFEEAEITIVEAVSGKQCSCTEGGRNGHTERFDCYSIVTNTVIYCKTHSKVDQLANETSYITDYECVGGTDGCDHEEDWQEKTTVVAAGTLTAEAANKVYGKHDETTCQAAYAYQNEQFIGTPNVGSATHGDTLYDALYTAFGEDINNLKLSYDEWQTEGNLDHATIYADSDDVFAIIRGLSETLLDIKGLASNPIISGIAGIAGVDMNALIQQYCSEDYQDPDDMLDAYSDHIKKQYPSNDNHEWDNVWEGAANAGLDYSYGMPDGEKPRNDFVYGTAIAYNKSFASYCIANGVPSVYADVIKDYSTGIGSSGTIYETMNSILGDSIPRTVNHAAFAGETYGGSKTLQEKFKDAGDSDGTWFNTCKELYTTYTTSDACLENGRAVYDMLITVYETKDVAEAYGDVNGGDMFAYYDTYLQEISALYNEAEAVAGDGIIIIVMVKDGLVDFQVSPAAADPRNKS